MVRIAANDIDLRRAGLLLYALQIANSNLNHHQNTGTKPSSPRKAPQSRLHVQTRKKSKRSRSRHPSLRLPNKSVILSGARRSQKDLRSNYLSQSPQARMKSTTAPVPSPTAITHKPKSPTRTTTLPRHPSLAAHLQRHRSSPA